MNDWQEWQRNKDEVHTRLGHLDNQLKLAEGITAVLRSGYRDKDTSVRCHRLEVQLYREMVATMERIWLASGGELPPLPVEQGQETEAPDDLPF